MTTPFRICQRWRAGFLGLILLPAAGFGQDTPAPPPAPSSPAPAASTANQASDTELLEVIGYAMAERVNLNIGFSESELETLLNGMRQFARGEPRPDGFQAKIPQAQRLYFERMREHRTQQMQRNRAAAESFLAELEDREGVEKTESGLYYEVLEAGSGAIPEIGDAIVVDYVGTRIDGTEFDSGEGVTFPLQSRGGLIEGFKEGVQLIEEGGSIRLYIPADLAYGENAPPGSAIQAGDTLVFTIKLHEVREGEAPAPPTMPPNFQPPGPPPSGPPSGTPPPPPSGPPPSPPRGN